MVVVVVVVAVVVGQDHGASAACTSFEGYEVSALSRPAEDMLALDVFLFGLVWLWLHVAEVETAVGPQT